MRSGPKEPAQAAPCAPAAPLREVEFPAGRSHASRTEPIGHKTTAGHGTGNATTHRSGLTAKERDFVRALARIHVRALLNGQRGAGNGHA